MSKGTCFVVQGFGKKTDYTDGRILDLDASYAVIKEGVEAAGFECLRADEIPHSGTIDVPMYEMLFRADLVIADLSTYNVNAAFELGVRYGLRPRATIIVAEEGFRNPFDVGHIVIRRYKHLGEDIGTREAKRFRDDLKSAIEAIMQAKADDSPVYTYLPDLRPPQRVAPPSADPTLVSFDLDVELGKPAHAPAPADAADPFAGIDAGIDAPGSGGAHERSRVWRGGGSVSPPAPAGTSDSVAGEKTAKDLLDEALGKINPPANGASDFPGACALLEEVLKQRPNDVFVVQQLALATYKSKQPDPVTALNRGKAVLGKLGPATTNDPETLGLWGAIHKRLWELRGDAADLGEAIDGYERGFRLRQDFYNGINLAFLLDVRALEAIKAGDKDEATADSVQARRVRREVTKYAAPLLDADDGDPARRYWIVATLWEAALGLGDSTETARWEGEAQRLPVPTWMQDTRVEQGRKLEALLAAYANLSRKVG